jgi:hypothetical protein
MTAFDVTIKDTLQRTTLPNAAASSGYVAQVGHDAKLTKYLELCDAVNMEFFPLAWETTGGATDVVHSIIARLTKLQADRLAGSSLAVLRTGLYRRISIQLQSHNARMVLDRLPSFVPGSSGVGGLQSGRMSGLRTAPAFAERAATGAAAEPLASASPDVPLSPAGEEEDCIFSPVAGDGAWLATAIV